MQKADRRTRVTVLVAPEANLVIAVAKAVGGLVAQSPAPLSEAAHSMADSLNEVFLLAALRSGAEGRHWYGRCTRCAARAAGTAACATRPCAR